MKKGIRIVAIICLCALLVFGALRMWYRGGFRQLDISVVGVVDIEWANVPLRDDFGWYLHTVNKEYDYGKDGIDLSDFDYDDDMLLVAIRKPIDEFWINIHEKAFRDHGGYIGYAYFNDTEEKPLLYLYKLKKVPLMSDVLVDALYGSAYYPFEWLYPPKR
ncbi:MAG: hypothetical protein LBN02_07060 [Oscillospiraceae bacterium]|nr:hypothetical protein [Oscillospiraceae bacterium]